MMIKPRDIVLIIKGEDFEGNNLVGKKAKVTNILTPMSKDVCITILDTGKPMFYPKEWLKVIERGL